MEPINRAIVALLPVLPKSTIRIFAQRYIAGETLGDAISVVRSLNQQGLCATLDVLGENVSTKEEAIVARETYKHLLRTIPREKLDSTISVKLTQLGLKLDREFCYQNMRELVQTAAEYSNFVRIDMEDSSCTSDTLDIFAQLRREFPNVGVAIQSYLKRSLEDVRQLTSLQANIRVCKGIYNEPPEIAYKDRQVIRDNFVRLVSFLLESNCYVGIATHDRYVIERCLGIIDERKISGTAYEFQMLLGVGEELRQQLVRNGHKLRVYVPFGEEWYPYSMRRLKENPKLAGYIMKNLFRKL